jgi:hypothetical protein
MASAWNDPRLLSRQAAASYVRAVTASVMEKSARGEPANMILRKASPDDKAAGTILKAASNPAMTTMPAWAGVLTMQRPADFVGMLAPSSCGLSLLAKCLQFEWPQGVSGLTIPAIDVAAPKTPAVGGQPDQQRHVHHIGIGTDDPCKDRKHHGAVEGNPRI